MAIGNAEVFKKNLKQGNIEDVERFFIYVGRGAGTNEGKLLFVNNDTDLDVALGSAESNLKTQIAAAIKNAGANFYCGVYPLEKEQTYDVGVEYCMTQTICEAFVITDPVSSSATVEAFHATAKAIEGEYRVPVIFIFSGEAIDPDTQSWAEYVSTQNSILHDLACDTCNPVCTIWKDDLGAYCGRLCNRSVTVADSPMRVETGAVIGIRSVKPVDNAGVEVSMAEMKALNSARWSVPVWRKQYPGVYFSDGQVLDVPAGDFQVIEHLRVINKAIRKVYVLAVAKIADRKLNSTPASISKHENYFMRPLRKMSKSVKILDNVFPGEITPPKEGDIVIKWMSNKLVSIYMVVRPYECPKEIKCHIMLDLNNYAE